MNLFTLILATAINTNIYSKADTIDYWHVKYNDKTIAEYTAFDKAPITIKKQDIKDSDILTVEYGNDTPCYDGNKGLYILSGNGKKIFLTTVGATEPLKVYLNYIIATKSYYHLKNLVFYYFDCRRNNLIFRLKIE
ncbi:hypothetical protein [Mucilaginibacter rubeus]|uniref:Uncharacterized protein n=1 Tax=Mucilaginibacter rubeus TaxID=2027860 RepID=A0A5C1HV86_9SPHI|nr:hypothetical protein [Mucilaginibacter rubeus]QEM09489.1 hypothetical protein DEO27_005470 [Mucilaginibacter rubeus]